MGRYLTKLMWHIYRIPYIFSQEVHMKYIKHYIKHFGTLIQFWDYYRDNGYIELLLNIIISIINCVVLYIELLLNIIIFICKRWTWWMLWRPTWMQVLPQFFCSHIHKSPIAYVLTSLFSSSCIPHNCSHVPTLMLPCSHVTTHVLTHVCSHVSKSTFPCSHLTKVYLFQILGLPKVPKSLI